MVFGRDGVSELGVVGQGHVEAVRSRSLQQADKGGQLLHQHTGVAVVGVLLPDRQLVVNGHAGGRLTHGGHRLHGKSGPVLGGATVPVGAVVHQRGREAAAHPVPVDLDHVEPGLRRTDRRRTEGGGNLRRLVGGHPGHQFGGLLVEQGTQVLHGDASGEDAGHILEHGLEVAVRLVKLGADEAALLVDQAAQGLVVGKALAAVKGHGAVTAHGHVADDDHGAAAGGNGPDFLPVLLLGEAQGGGGKDDAVFQRQPPDGDGLEHGLVHFGFLHGYAGHCPGLWVRLGFPFPRREWSGRRRPGWQTAPPSGT